MSAKAPTIGVVSLGCPKALVDSERIITRLRSEGYQLSGSYEGADLVVVNTCGFLDSAKAESLDAIGEAIAENGKVIVTGCLGKEENLIREAHPKVLEVTGPHQYEAVVGAVHTHLPQVHDPYRQAGRRKGWPVCVPRSSYQEAQLPRSLDPTHQRRRA